MSLKACSRSEIRECRVQKKVKDIIRERDRISELPDDILCSILSSLPTRNSVGTSTLSKRWMNVWTTVPVIEIDYLSLWRQYAEYQIGQSKFFGFSIFKDWFMKFVERVLLASLNLSYEVSCVRKLRLSCLFDFDSSRFGKWIEVVTKLNDLEELDLSFSGHHYFKLPPNTFTCKKLVILKLAKSVVLNLPSPSVCLPSLKELHLLSGENLDVNSVNNFLIGCPVLEELRIERRLVDNMGMKTLCVESSSLKSLTLISWNPLIKLVIDASNLERLDLIVDRIKQVDVNCSLSSLVTVKLEILRSYYTQSKGRDICEINVRELLMKMSSTKYLCLSAAAMMSLELRGLDYLPVFNNLMHLRVGNSYSSLLNLPCLLESCPNLTYFSLFKCEFQGLPYPHPQSRTPRCLMLYLEKIDLHIFGFGGYEIEMEMVSYFLKIAPVLKKMSITFGKAAELSNFQRKVHKLPKVSASCEIDVSGF